MANTKQAKKRVIQAEVRREHNAARRSSLRTVLKKVSKSIEVGALQAAQEAYRAAVPLLDRFANSGLIHKNKAARHKSRLNAKIKALAEQSRTQSQ